MTPAVDVAKKIGIEFITHTCEHDPQHQPFGEETAEKLELQAERVFKTWKLN